MYMTIAIITAVIVVLILLYFVSTYNSLVGLRNKVKDQWSQIDVVLKNRNEYLKNISFDKTYFDINTEKLIDQNIKIYKYRKNYIENINKRLKKY